MLLIGLTSLLIAIPLYSSTITPTLLTRITSIILLFSATLSFNTLYLQAIGSGLGLYSGLFHVTTVTQSMEMFLYIIGAFILLGYASQATFVPQIQNLYQSTFLYQENLDRETDKDNDQLFINPFTIRDRNDKGTSDQSAHSSYKSEESDATRYHSQSTIENDNVSFVITKYPTIPEYPLIILFTTMGASFLISSADLVSMYLSIELQSFAVYILAAIYRNSESATSAGLKYFLLGALSSALILLGSSLIYAYTGLTHFEGIYLISNCEMATLFDLSGDNYRHAIKETLIEKDTPIFYKSSEQQGVVLGILIIGIGFLFKVASAPFHS